jgi:hypothetical protein
LGEDELTQHGCLVRLLPVVAWCGNARGTSEPARGCLVRLLPDEHVRGSEHATTRADASSNFCLSRQICRMERRRTRCMVASLASCTSRRCEMAWQRRRHIGARLCTLAAARRRRVARGPAATCSTRPGSCVWRRKREGVGGDWFLWIITG